MNTSLLIKNVRIVNEGTIQHGAVVVKDQYIDKVLSEPHPASKSGQEVIDGKGHYLLPGAIDDQVHFREPGLTHKADIYTESRAAVAGGITSYMEMPNTKPQTVTQELLEEKYQLAARKSLVNFSFYMGTTNDNLDEVLKTDPQNVCGIKIFMGSSTGNMLVDNPKTLEQIFSKANMLVATHCEDENTIRRNTFTAKEKYGEEVPFELHPVIRSAEACYASSSLAVSLARKYKTRLHILHVSTKKELELFDSHTPLADKQITAEACVHHLMFDDSMYPEKQWRIKWNPAVKTRADRNGLLEGLLSNKLDVVATDHAPHTLAEKQNTYFKAPSGGPLVQHALPAMLEFYHQKKMTLPQIVQKMCHAPAVVFDVENRGFIRPGYYADLVLVDVNQPWQVTKNNILYKCGWSPFEGMTFKSRILTTFVNGHKVYDRGRFDETRFGQRLTFNR
jgi:dihydroorotase